MEAYRQSYPPLPNVWAERADAGMALGPRGGCYAWAPRGPSARPVEVRSAQTL